MQRRPVIGAIAALALMSPGLVRAEDDLGRINPYIKETAIAVLQVDVERVDPEQIVALISADGTAEGLSGLAQHVAAFRDKLRAAGVEHLYGIYSLSDIGNTTPYLVIPMADAESARDLAADLLNRGGAGGESGVSTSDYLTVTEAVASVVFCGSAAARRRFGAQPVAERPGLAAAFAAAADAPICVAYVPTADQQRVLAEMLPKLPDDAGGLDGVALASLQWLAAANSADGTLQLTFEATAETQVTSLNVGLPGLLGALLHWRTGGSADGMTSVESHSEGTRGTIAFPRRDGQPGTTVRNIVQLFGGLSNQFDSLHSLKQIGLAMHNFHDAWESFPPPASYDGGKPLLSWRVHLLPWLDKQDLYNEFHLHEPWDSEHNRQLIRRMPAVFMSHDFTLNLQGKTTFVLPVGGQTMYHGQSGIAIKDLTDGTSNTLMALQTDAEHAVTWTKPDDLPIDFDRLDAGFAGAVERFACLFADGSTRRVSTSIPPETLKALLTPAGKDTYSWDFDR